MRLWRIKNARATTNTESPNNRAHNKIRLASYSNSGGDWSWLGGNRAALSLKAGGGS